MAKAANHDVYFVPGLHRGLRVLEILSAAETPMTLSDIARAMDLSRSSAYRLVYTLRQMEFVKQAEQANTFTLGARVLNLGFAYLYQQPITESARMPLAELRDVTGVSTYLSVLDGHDVLYLMSNQARSNYVSNMRTGTRTQAYASAVGWVLLGALDGDEVDAFCEAQRFEQFTDHTPMNAADLKTRIAEAQSMGHVVSRGFRDPGGSSLAVPVRNNTGHIVACVNLSGPDTGFDFDRLDTFYVPETKAVALRISRDLGYQGD
jgi:IclR family pca regulon transcriptional regulator